MTSPARQLSLLPDPPAAHARASHPETSHEAARSVTGISDRQAAIIRVFEAFGPMSDERLVKIYERLMREQPNRFPLQAPSGIRSRRAELADPEKTQPPKIVFSGRKDVTTSGRSTRIWTLAKEAWKETA